MEQIDEVGSASSAALDGRVLWRASDAGVRKLTLVFLHPSDFVNAFHALLSTLQKRPKIGLEYVRGAAAAEGLASEIVDEHDQPVDLELLLRRLVDRGTPFVGLYATSFNRARVTTQLRSLRAALPAARLVVGGPGAFHAAQFLEAGADAVFVGEADDSLREYIRYLRTGAPRPDAIAGLALATSAGEVHHTASRPYQAELDRFPWPVRVDPRESSCVDWFAFPFRRPFITALASRGCPFHCTFCSSPSILGHKVRLRSARDVVGELVDAHGRFGCRDVLFVDDVFGWRDDWMREFTDAMRAAPVRFRYMVILHPLSFFQHRAEMIERLADSGCTMISYGAQSADPGVLARVRRSPNEPEALAGHLELTNRLGIASVVTYIFGLPGATAASMESSVDFALAHRPTLVDIHPLGLLPGAELGTHDELAIGAAGGDFTAVELQRLCNRGLKRFYTSPATMARLARFVAATNPRWFAEFPWYLLRELRTIRSQGRRHRASAESVSEYRPTAPLGRPAVVPA